MTLPPSAPTCQPADPALALREIRSMVSWLQKTDIQELFNQGYIDNVCTQVSQDMVIWNNKIYNPDPILCDGDGPLINFVNGSRSFMPANHCCF